MALATMCASCSYQWIVDESVAASWACVRCDANLDPVTDLRCSCGHVFTRHDCVRRVGNAIVAKSLAGHLAMKDAYHRSPFVPALPDPPIGGCLDCKCALYARVEMTLSRDN